MTANHYDNKFIFIFPRADETTKKLNLSMLFFVTDESFAGFDEIQNVWLQRRLTILMG